MRQRTTAAALAGLVLATGLAATGGSLPTAPVGPAVAEQPVRTSVPASRWGSGYLPNLPVVDQDGRAWRFYDDLVKDKRVVINFIFTTCTDICPLTTARMAAIQERLGDAVGRDVHFISITVDPERDGPRELKRYAEAFRVGPGWTFVTGRPEDITAIRAKLGERSKVLNEHKHEILLGDSRAGSWQRDSVFGDLERVIINIRSMDPDFRLPRPAGGTATSRVVVVDDTPGQTLFAKACSSCHTIGRGGRVGPDLAGVARRRDRAWLTEFVSRPDRMFAKADPTALALARDWRDVRMPNLGLSEADAADVLAYIEAQSYAIEAAASDTGSRRPHVHHE